MNILCLSIFILGINLWPMSAFKSHDKIAYVKIHNDFWQVWLTDTNNSGAEPLTDSQVDKCSPDWSRDGKRLAYATTDGELWIIETDTKRGFKVPLSIPAAEPRWSRDGKGILFTCPKDVFRDDADIWRVDINGKNLAKITKRPWAQFNPAWFPDENEILFVDSPEILGDEICKINIKTQDIIRLTQNRFNDIQPSAVGKGDEIAYASNQDGNYDVWIMDRFGQHPSNITNNPNHDIMPRPSRRGDKIYFLSDRSGVFQIYSAELKTKSVKQITFDDGDKKDFAIYSK